MTPRDASGPRGCCPAGGRCLVSESGQEGAVAQGLQVSHVDGSGGRGSVGFVCSVGAWLSVRPGGAASK